MERKEDYKGIKNIVFDLGGVVIDLDRRLAERDLEALGLKNAADLLGEYRQKGLFLRLESGEITAAEFYEEVRRAISAQGGDGASATDVKIQDAFNSFLVCLPKARLERIRAARAAGFRTFALSNTNAVMYDSWIKKAFTQEGLRIDDYFDGILKSYAEGVCKPNPEIFRLLLRRFGLKPEETLFLDDSEENCEGARREGIQAIKIDGEAPRDMVSRVGELLSLSQPLA